MKKNRKPILIYFASLLVLALLIYAVPKVTDIFETTAVLETGTIQVTEESMCYFVRDEAVYVAGAPGEAEFTIEEGTHICTGTILADFTEDETEGADEAAPRSKYADVIDGVGDDAVRTVSFESKSSGIVSYYADGYESTLTPDSLDTLTWEDVSGITSRTVDLKHTSLKKGDPVLKICDNDNWYIVCWVEAASVANYTVGNEVSITLPEGTVDMEVESITQDGERWKIIFWSNNYYEAFAESRVEEGIIVSQDYTGLITETENIITKDGQPGVMVLRKNGDYEFVRVKIKASDGEYSALEDVSFTDEEGQFVNTVNVYDEILRRPGNST